MTLSIPSSARVDRGLVADVADDQLGVIGQVFGPLAVAVDLLDQAVEHAHLIAATKKFTGDGAADESSAACDKTVSPKAGLRLIYVYLLRFISTTLRFFFINRFPRSFVPDAASFRRSTDQAIPRGLLRSDHHKKMLQVLRIAGRAALEPVAIRCVTESSRRQASPGRAGSCSRRRCRSPAARGRCLGRPHARSPRLAALAPGARARIRPSAPATSQAQILATDQVMRGVMIERVCLEQAIVGGAQPFVRLKLVVGTHARHPA